MQHLDDLKINCIDACAVKILYLSMRNYISHSDDSTRNCLSSNSFGMIIKSSYDYAYHKVACQCNKIVCNRAQ